MASVIKQSNGHKAIQFRAINGRGRKTLRLGKATMRHARTVKTHVEDLATAVRSNQSPSDETANWLRGISDEIHAKLSRVGLIASRLNSTLATFLQEYIDSRNDVSDSSKNLYHQTRNNLIEFVGAETALRSITPGRCDEFKGWMRSEKSLAEATENRRCGCAKQFSARQPDGT